MDNKKKYIAPEAEVMLIAAKDIIAFSGDEAPGDNGGFDPFNLDSLFSLPNIGD